MTAIVGIVKKNKVYMGGDAAYLRGWEISLHPGTKVFSNDNCIIGVAGEARCIDILRYHFQIPNPSTDDLPTYMSVDFAEAIRQVLKDKGYSERENESESFGSYFLVGIAGRLFEIGSTYEVIEHESYAAIGSGADVALGALYATENKSPIDRIELALKAAECHTIGVRGPFQILCR